jgi:hypothetical protein
MKYLKTFENYSGYSPFDEGETQAQPITKPVTKPVEPDTKPRPNIRPIPAPVPGTDPDPQAYKPQEDSYDWLVWDEGETETKPVTKPVKPDTKPRPNISPIPAPVPGTDPDPQAKKGTIQDRFGDFLPF